MSADETPSRLQSFAVEFSYGDTNEDENAGQQHYKMRESMKVTKTSNGTPIKMYTYHSLETYVNTLGNPWPNKLQALQKAFNNPDKALTERHSAMAVSRIDYPTTGLDITIAPVCARSRRLSSFLR